MRARYWYPIKFTEDSCKGLKMVSNKLTALEVEFFKSILEPKNVSFKKLERFRISLGAQLGASTSENTLKLVASKEEISECKIDELFEKTEELELCTNGMNSLEDISKHPSEYSFCNLKVLKVDKCAELTYIFTVDAVSSLTKLERLTVSECPLIESLVKGDNSGANKAIKLLELKFLELKKLPEFVRLCDVEEVVMDLPQLMELVLDSLPNMTCIFSRMQLLLNSKVLIPKLGRLKINEMEKLKEIWCETATSSEEVDYISTLREIKVSRCKSMVNLFPRNPMRLLTHLETLEVRFCSSIEMLFNIDLQGSIGNVSGSNSSLRGIFVSHLENLKEVWRIEGGDDNNSGSSIIIHDFQGVKSLAIQYCHKFRSIFTPTTIYFNMGALEYIKVMYCGQRGELVTDGQKQEMIPVVAIPSSLLHTFRQLPEIILDDYDVEVVFDMKSQSQSQSQSQSSRDLITTMPKQQPCKLDFSCMNRMTHVWKCNWDDYFICQNQHPTSLFHNITTIYLSYCKSIKYLFSPLMATLLSNLKEIEIWCCDGIEEVVSNRDDDKGERMTPSTTTNTLTPTTLFPRLDSFTLYKLPILKHVGGGVAKGTTNLIHDQLKVPEVGVVYWSLCLYSRKIHIQECDALSSVIPSCTTGQRVMVEKMVIEDCKSMKEVFATTVENDNVFHSTISDEGSGVVNTSVSIPRHGKITAHKLSNLKTLHIIKCDSLKYIFTFSTLESLKKLKEIRIKRCKAMKVIVREEEEGDQTTTTTPNNNNKVVVFPRLEVIELVFLPNLEGFFSGIIKEFQWPHLNDVYIERCPKMAAFTCSKSIAPRLKYVEYPIFGKLSPERYNFYMTSPSPDQITSPSLESTTSCPVISKDEKPLSLEDIKEINVENGRSDVIIAFGELLQLKNLEKIHAKRCKRLKKIFEVELEVTDSEFNNESQTIVVKLPKLREVVLEELENLNYLWKNNKWRQLELPNLTRLSIHNCNWLDDVFATSMVSSFMQLQELHVTHCRFIKVIVHKDDDCERIVLPCLKSLKLEHLQRLKGFCLWDKDFALPSLSTLVIKQCPELSIFTNGFVATPMLKVMETNEGLIDVGEQDINSFIITNKQKGRHF